MLRHPPAHSEQPNPSVFAPGKGQSRGREAVPPSAHPVQGTFCQGMQESLPNRSSEGSEGSPGVWDAPFPSSIRMTKYLLESVTPSTAIPGNCSTGAWAKSSPGKQERGGVTPCSAPQRCSPRSGARSSGDPLLTRGLVLQLDEGCAALGRDPQAAAPGRLVQLPFCGSGKQEGECEALCRPQPPCAAPPAAGNEGGERGKGIVTRCLDSPRNSCRVWAGSRQELRGRFRFPFRGIARPKVALGTGGCDRTGFGWGLTGWEPQNTRQDGDTPVG